MFKRTIENFKCENCGYKVTGNGYTNHCPKCLWSKHVDVHPGDRAEACQGMMRPIAVQQEHGEYFILHKCERCGLERRNKTAPEDDFEKLIELAKNTSQK